MVDSPSETTALLSHSEQDYDFTSSITPSDDENTPKTFRTAHRVTILIIVIVFLNVCGDMIMESPMTRICESVICYQYFETADPSKIKRDRAHVGPGAIGGVDEMSCKADQVQDKLAELNGMMQLFDSVATLVLAVPFGWTADRFGRWPLVFFNLLQFALRAVWNQFITWNWQVFDVRSIWFASALSVMGGGSAVISALLYVVVADITSETDRTAAFLRIGATIMSANLLMPPLSAWLMQKDPWIPALVGTALMMAATPLSFCIPETLGYAKLHNAPSTTPTRATQSSREHPPPFKLNTTKLNPFTRLLQKAQSTILFLLRNWRIPILILPFTTHYLIGTINRLLLQYSSKRYTLTLSTSVLILAIRNAATVLLLIIILPYLSTSLTQKHHFTELKKDLYLARASQIICTVGWLGLALSPNIFSATVSLVGTAFVTCAQLLLRSILASCVPEGKIAEVYSFISVVDTVGTIAGAPALAKMFQEGLRLGEVWIGLPFGVLGMVSGVFAGLLFMVGCGDGMSGGGDRDGDGDEGEGVE